MGIENLILGFHIAITPFNLFMAVVGILLGTIIGVLPGLGGANGVAILLPVTFTMPPTSAIILLTSIYWGALFGGAITSILFNIPGEPWSVATTFDGYPMARQGQGGQALTAAFTSSFVGALFSIVLITFFAPVLAQSRNVTAGAVEDGVLCDQLEHPPCCQREQRELVPVGDVHRARTMRMIRRIISSKPIIPPPT